MDLPPEVREAAPGVAGSFTALLLMLVRGDRFKHAVLLAIAGAVFAKFMAPVAAEIMHSTQGVAGYVTGVFGMAIVAKVMDMILSFDSKKAAREAWLAVLKRVRG